MEGCKEVMRGKITEITTRVKEEHIVKQKELESKIKEFEHQNTANNCTVVELKETTQKLDELLTYKTEGALRFTNS